MELSLENLYVDIGAYSWLINILLATKFNIALSFRDVAIVHRSRDQQGCLFHLQSMSGRVLHPPLAQRIKKDKFKAKF